MRTSFICILLLLVLYCHACERSLSTNNSDGGSELLYVYEVNRKVVDFPDRDDFSTPEAAYAVVNRVMAKGEAGGWRRISVKALADELPPVDAKKQEVPLEVAKVWLNAWILEVRIFKNRHAVVIAELLYETRPTRFEQRSFELESGKWLNAGGHRVYDSLDKARVCADSWSKFYDKPARPKIDDPDSYLKPFVEFLRDKAEEPKKFVMKALGRYQVVIMSEIHHRPWYWAFNSSLITDPDFPKAVGTIYMELPSNDQGLVDKFLSLEKCDTAPVVEMLRDVLWMGWPDQAMLDFFITVWMVNQNLKPEQQLRIILVDIQRPWKNIKSRADWSQYESVSRDQQMAENILRDLQDHPNEKRNALLIAGVMHAALNHRFFEGSPVLTAGYYLREKLGEDKVYAILQHRCVQTNMGRVDGRLCLGLFDSAFAVVGNKNMAFPLDEGPFGKELYDADPDRIVVSTYSDGFNAYLYLGSLEYETFSPLIAGFYTDDFVKEIDRRYRIMFNKGLVEGCRLAKLDAESFINWMSGSVGGWGKPRKNWQQRRLGPINAWHYGGSDWKKAIRKNKYKYALEHPEEIIKAAQELFEAIRVADYNNPERWKDNPDAWKEFIAPEYWVNTAYPKWVKWICETFKNNPIQTIELGEVFKSEVGTIWSNNPGLPAVHYKVALRDGNLLEGNLPFDYDVKSQCWVGKCGIDWHLPNKADSTRLRHSEQH